ncbi:MAG: hypothetical protein GY814_01730, partial [Gammaproteobacteria bacterium]|nr:hypothetical protein [Gammaproteobacteria bacterium]
STDLSEIAASIYDRTEHTTDSPLVNFGGYLDGAGGSPTGVNVFMGTDEPLTLSSGTYVLIGISEVTASATLTVEPGVTFTAMSGGQLNVQGNLVISGESGNPVTFTSASGAPAAEDWNGIEVKSGGSVSIDYAVVEYADKGIKFVDGSTGSVTNSILRNNQYGIYIDGVATINALSDNSIEDNSRSGIYITGRTGAIFSNGIAGNNLTRNVQGIYLYRTGATPLVTNNTITANEYGVRVEGYRGTPSSGYSPLPVVTGNSIYANTVYNYHAGSYWHSYAASIILDASGNWWGSTDLSEIAAKIYDYNDNSAYSPVVNFGGYLDGEGSTSSDTDAGLGGGGSVGDATVLVSGKTYLIFHSLTVPAGETLTIPAGVRLVFWSSNHGLTVNGTLDIQGTVDSPVTFTSANAVPAAGDW